MKKLTTITLSVIAGSVLAYNAYSLTCAQQPTCESLGYTLTSTSDCIGTVLKCPFNTARYYCTTKTEALNKLKQDMFVSLMPNYPGWIARSLNQQYTASSNGYLIGWDNHNSDGYHTGFRVLINGQNVRLHDGQVDFAINSWIFPIAAGQTYEVRMDYNKGQSEYVFVPMRG